MGSLNRVTELRLQPRESIALLLVGGQPVFRDALRTLFDNEPGFSVIGEAATPRQAVAAIAGLTPDVVLVGLSGRPLVRLMRALRNMAARGHDTRVMLMTTPADAVSLRQAGELGVSGILSRTTPPAAVIDSVRSVAAAPRGRDPLDGLAGQLVHRRRGDGEPFGMTQDELEAVEASVRGCLHQLELIRWRRRAAMPAREYGFTRTSAK